MTGVIIRRPGATTGPAPKATPTAWIGPIDAYVVAQLAVGRAATTVELRRKHLEHVARQMRCTPEKVEPRRLAAWFNRQDRWSPDTRRSYRNTLLSFYRWAVREGITASNPATAIPPVKQVITPPRPAPVDAVRLALATADPRVLLLLRLGAEVGLRRLEIASVHTRNLKETASGPVLLVHGKGNKWRTVPITESLAACIRRGAAGHTPGCSDVGWLFPGTAGGHLSPRWVGKLMSRVMPEHWTAHALRHYFATRAYEGTHDIRAVQRLLGHASVTTTERYTLIGDDSMRAAMMAALDL